ncbi:MAG: hypothetical protein ABIK52_09075, partial [Bacteroidota bacterium]
MKAFIPVTASRGCEQSEAVSETTLKSSRRGRFHWTHSRPIIADLKVYPNPARDFVIVEYRKDNMFDNAILEVLDMNGRKIKCFFLQKNDTQQII